MLKKSLAVLTFLLVLSSIASAQGLVNTGIGLGPQLGYYKSGDADDGRFMVGVALRARLSPIFGLEGSINYRQESYGDNAVKVRSWPVMLTAMVYPIPIIYGALGAGWYNTTFDYDDDLADRLEDGTIDLGDETKQSFGWHLGAGLELPVGENMKLTGDIRYVFLGYEFRDFAQSALLNDVNSNFYAITVGLLFGF